MTVSTSRIRAVFAALVLGSMVSACGYNAIPTQEEQAKAKWADVHNNYQRRADLIPNLVATVQGYAKQEKDVLTAVVEARAKATSVRIDVSQLDDPAKLKQFLDAQGQLQELTIDLPPVNGQKTEPIDALYSDYGAPVTVDKPAASEITEAPDSIYKALGAS